MLVRCRAHVSRRLSLPELTDVSAFNARQNCRPKVCDMPAQGNALGEIMGPHEPGQVIDATTRQMSLCAVEISQRGIARSCFGGMNFPPESDLRDVSGGQCTGHVLMDTKIHCR
jgi:hypothetical protein